MCDAIIAIITAFYVAKSTIKELSRIGKFPGQHLEVG